MFANHSVSETNIYSLNVILLWETHATVLKTFLDNYIRHILVICYPVYLYTVFFVLLVL